MGKETGEEALTPHCNPIKGTSHIIRVKISSCSSKIGFKACLNTNTC